MDIDQLEQLIEHLDTCYELGEPCFNPFTDEDVSDAEYDRLRELLKKLKPNSPLLSTPTASKVVADKVIVHDPPMASLEKANGTLERRTEILNKWMKAYVKQGQQASNDCNFVMCYKVDGVAIGLYYENGKLVKAGLRPRDGIHGSEVLANALKVKGIPSELPVPVTCSIRGEVLCLKEDFNKLNAIAEKEENRSYANPRNLTAGTLQLKDSTKVEARNLRFLAYSIENLDEIPYTTELERADWAKKVLGIPFVDLLPYTYNNLTRMEAEAAQQPYDVDGVVVSVNHLEDALQLGRHGDNPTGNPRAKIAWKFADETATPVVKQMVWEIGRTGSYTPVAVFSPVRLAGAMINRATAHNLGFVRRKRIGVGATILIRRSGQVIPQILEVPVPSDNADIPQKCLHCHRDLVEMEGGRSGDTVNLELACINPSCDGQLVRFLEYFIATLGIKEVGSRSIEDMFNNGLVREPAQFFALTTTDLGRIGWSQRESLITVAAIQLIPNPESLSDDKLIQLIDERSRVKKRVAFWRLFSALGIPGVGESTSNALLDAFGSLENIRSASVDALDDVPNIGEITAKNIFDYLIVNEGMINNVLKYVEPELPNTEGKLSGKVFVLSGKGARSLKEAIQSQGGKTADSVSRKVSYLVAGEGSGEKSVRAASLGIPIITVDQMRKMLE